MAGNEPALRRSLATKRRDHPQLHPLAAHNRPLVPGQHLDQEVAEKQQSTCRQTGQPGIHELVGELHQAGLFVPY